MYIEAWKAVFTQALRLEQREPADLGLKFSRCRLCRQFVVNSRDLSDEHEHLFAQSAVGNFAAGNGKGSLLQEIVVYVRV